MEKIITIDFDTSATASFDASTIGGLSDGSNWKIYLHSFNFSGHNSDVSPISSYYVECDELSPRSNYYTNQMRSILFRFCGTPALILLGGLNGSQAIYNITSFNEIYLGKMKNLFKFWNFKLNSTLTPTIINFSITLRLVKES